MNDNLTGILIFAGMVALFIAGTFISRAQARKRREALTAWAQSKSLLFSDTRDSGMENRFPGFAELRRGEDRYAYNIINGYWRERMFAGFDYHYMTRSTDSKGRRRTHHHHFSAVVISAPCPLKPLTIAPESIFHRVADALGFDDIDFESAEFSRTFRVHSPDRKWAYAVLHPRAMEFLLSDPVYPMTLALNGVIAYGGSRFRPEQFGEAADRVCGLLDLLPDYLVREQKEIAGPQPS